MGHSYVLSLPLGSLPLGDKNSTKALVQHEFGKGGGWRRTVDFAWSLEERRPY